MSYEQKIANVLCIMVCRYFIFERKMLKPWKIFKKW